MADWPRPRSVASIAVSEPWEFASDQGSKPPRLRLSDSYRATQGSPEQVLAELLPPVPWHGDIPRFVVIQATDGTDVTTRLAAGLSVDCSVVGVADDRVADGPPWGADLWRGGFALRGQLRLIG